MAYHKVQLGKKIYLKLQLSDDDVGLFPEVTILDQIGTSIAGSPVSLTHIANGLYKDSTLIMPNTDEVTAHYRVYSDAGHTKRYECHDNTLMDVFERDFNADLIDQLTVNINSLLSGSLPGDQILGFIEDGEELTGLLFDTDLLLVGEIEDNRDIYGLISEEELLVGLLDSPEQSLVGFIYC